jgi:hypothetical protein
MARRVKYTLNVVEWRGLFETETDDEQEPDAETA